MRPTQLLSFPAFAFLLAAISPAQAAGPSFSAKLWIVDTATANNASFPVPPAVPDATFEIGGISCFGTGPNVIDQKLDSAYRIGAFLKTCEKLSNLQFSGLVNPVINKVVTAKTLLSDVVANQNFGTYGTFLEITGEASLADGDAVSVTHDDGMTLNIDGVTLLAHTNADWPENQYALFSGTTGLHQIDIAYAEVGGGPAQLAVTLVPASGAPHTLGSGD